MYCQHYVGLAGKHCFLHWKFHLYLEQFFPLFQYFLWQKWHFRLWLWQCCLHQLYLEEEMFLQLHWSFCSLIDTCFKNNQCIGKYFTKSFLGVGGGSNGKRLKMEETSFEKVSSAKYHIQSKSIKLCCDRCYMKIYMPSHKHIRICRHIVNIASKLYMYSKKPFFGGHRNFWFVYY